VTPIEDTNPVRTQHLLVATVKNADGEPLHSRRVEWIIAEGSIGEIIELDESGWYNTRGYKVNNKYAISHTNRGDHLLTFGNDDPSDDVQITKGQTWCVITSPIEGDTHMIVYAPAIFDWNNHKVFAVKHWLDATWEWPPAATNTIGTPHDLAVKVMKNSDGTPYEGWTVNFNVVDGPAGNITPASVKTDASGVARARLTQVTPVEGVNTIGMEIIRPEDNSCGRCSPAMRIAGGVTTKTWVGPRIGITKSAPATAGVGDQFDYNIVVTNPGRATATNAKVVDALPDGIQYVSSEPAAQAAGQNLQWSLGDIAAGASKSISVRVKATKTGTFENCADVTADNNLSARACDETVVTAPKLALSKTGPAAVLDCETITYTVVVRNNGDGVANNVKIVDALPNGLKASDGSGSVTIDVGTLAPGQERSATYTVTPSAKGTYKNTAVATGDPSLRAEASHQVIVRQPVLVLTKTGPAKRYVDRTAEYTLTVKNTGDGDARDTVLVDTLPAGLSFVSATGGGSNSGGRVTWSMGTLKPGDSKTVTLKVMAMQIGTMRDSAVATALCEQVSAELTTEIVGIPAILLEVVDQEDPIEIGDNETYTIVVTNQGSAVGTNILIVATLPAEQQYVSSDGPTTATAAGQKVSFAPLASLAAKARATYHIVVKGTAAGDVRFKVELTSDQMSTPAGETESTHIYE